MEATCNGWKNYNTWNIALWLNNDEGLYRTVQRYINKKKKQKLSVSYTDFLVCTGLGARKTPDGVHYADKSVSRTELTTMLKEFNQ